MTIYVVVTAVVRQRGETIAHALDETGTPVRFRGEAKLMDDLAARLAAGDAAVLGTIEPAQILPAGMRRSARLI